MTTTIKIVKAYASILGLGALLVFTSCVKKHGDKTDNTDSYLAITEVGTDAVDAEGKKVGVLNTGVYLVEDDYLGCSSSAAEIQAAGDSKNPKTVVTLSNGEQAACVKPSSLALTNERPAVTFFKQPNTTDFYIQTREVIRRSARTESKDGIKVEGDIGIRVLDIVDYTTNSPILNEIKDRVDLRALPGEKYKVYHKITPKVLYVMKVSTKDKLSHLDLPIADNLGNGEYAVPIAAVEIELSQYRPKRNADNETTNVYEFAETKKLSEATHIKFDIGAVVAIGLPEDADKDVYPATYFTEGQWYFSESVVEARPGFETLIGLVTGGLDTEFRNASLVQFTRTSASLVACNVGIDDRYADDALCGNSATVITIPATGHSYKLDRTSTEVTEYDILGSQAPLVKLDLDDVSSMRKSIDELLSIVSDTNEDQLISVNFYKDKFNFIAQRGTNGRRIMYSFLRADNRSNYKVRRHYKDDRQNRFGYFVQRVEKFRNSDTIDKEEDLERDYLIQRHDPSKDIVFNFSSLTPKSDGVTEDQFGLKIDYREIGRKSIEYWNKAYERAGAPNRVVLAKDDAPFGDIAFNTMNLIDSVAGANLLGVGPSLVDPYSGEVINANANVYIAPFRSIVARHVREYIRAKTNIIEEPAKQLPDSAKVNSTLLGDMTDSISGVTDILADLVPDDIAVVMANLYHYGAATLGPKPVNRNQRAANSDQVANLYKLGRFDSENTMVKNLIKVSQQIPEMNFLEKTGKITFSPRSKADVDDIKQALEVYRPYFYRSFFMSEVAAGRDYNSMTAEIETKCGPVLTLVGKINERAAAEEAPARFTTQEELPALKHCMAQIIPGKFQATLIHEIGHTLGLRHNFKATADKKNFFEKSEVEEIYGVVLEDHEDAPRSTSVMDYVRTEQDRLVYPGHYDIAAIRYGYANKVEVESAATRPNTKEGKYVNLLKAETNEVDGSIFDELQGLTLKDFGYCTDTEASLEVDPLCDRHDFGTNPKMIVEDNINSFWESLTLYNFRYNGLNVGLSGLGRRVGNMQKLKRIYTEWRIHLANHLGRTDSTGNVYLQRFNDPEQYKALLDDLSKDEDFAGKEYLAVRDQIFDFMMEVAFFPNKYCMAMTPAGLKAVEFSKLRDELKNQVPAGTKIASCENDRMKEQMASKGFTYLYEAGLPVDNLWYFVNPKDTFEESVSFNSFRAPLDVIGTYLDRSTAANMFGSRGSGYISVLEKMFPSMMDEPDLYQKYEERILARLTEGVDLKEIFTRVNAGKVVEAEVNGKIEEITIDRLNLDNRFTNFSAESSLLKSLWVSLEQGSRNNFVERPAVTDKFVRQITGNPDVIEQARASGGFVLPLTSGNSVVVRQEATTVFTLAQKITEIIQTFQGANQQVPTAEQLKGIGPGLQNIFVNVSNALALQEGQVELSVEQYMNFARNLNQVMNAHPILAAAVEQSYIAELAPYLIFLKGAEDAIAQAQAAEQEPPAGAVEAVQSTLAEWNTKGLATIIRESQEFLNGRQIPITVIAPTEESVIAKYEAVEPAIDAGVAEATQQRDAQALYVEVNGDELFAQYEMLRAILSFQYSDGGVDFNLRIAELLGDVAASAYDDLIINSNPAVKGFAQDHLNPRLIAKKRWGFEFQADKLSKRKF
jgi:uncharacterized protein YlzI (FlbEa/FlbD family)